MVDEFTQTLLGIMVAVIMLGMGASLTPRDFYLALKRPYGLMIGVISQYGIMPLLGFLLSPARVVPDAIALGILIMACMPGGTTSNIFTYFSKGNLALSVLMTVTSTLTGVILIPVILLVYAAALDLEIPREDIIAVLIVLAVAVGRAGAVNRWRLQVNERTGEPARGGTWAIPVFVLVGFWGAFFVGTGITTPELDGRSLDGGMTLQPEYFALLLALVIYTASHIAELVRGAIQAVPKGQVEAASALALSNWHRLRHVVLPQALRIAVPPLGNQYLNLMKNSSLGFVISYFEVTKTVQTTVGNRSPAVPAFLLLIGIYLVMSLVISAGVNVVNRRLQVVER